MSSPIGFGLPPVNATPLIPFPEKPTWEFGAVWKGVWADRPSAAAVTAGTRIVVEDVGANNYSEWFSDGTYWRPVGGSLLLFNWVSGKDAPLASIAGISALAEFPGLNRVPLPAGLLSPNSQLRVRARASKVGAVGTATLDPRITEVPGLAIATAVSLGAISFSSAHVYAAVEAEAGVDSSNKSYARVGWGFATANSSSTILLSDTTALRIGQYAELAIAASVAAADVVSLQAFQVVFEA